MVFDDEFSSGAVNSAKWNVDNGPNSANNEAEWYSPDNVYLSGGNLVLKSEVRSINGYQYASGKVTTAGKFSLQYGRIEVRARLPTGKGIWPAHWLLPYGHWPPEIDITELIGSVPQNLVVSYHEGPLPSGCVYPWDCGMTHNTTVWWNLDWTQDFHTYAVDWDWWGIKWYVDNVEVYATYATPPSEPMFLILNTAVGGNWPGLPDGSTVWPQLHQVDYVRMYQRWYGNALLNGGFEQVEDNGFANWNTIGEGTNISANATPQFAHSGSRAARISGRCNAATNSTWLVQNLPASEGQIWQASVWAANRPGDLLQGRNNACFKLEFLDSVSTLLSQYSLTALTSNSPAAYAQYVIRQKAPSGAAAARITLEFNQYDYAAGSVNFDDAQLFLVTTDLPGATRAVVNGDFAEGDGNDFISWNAYGAASNIVAETASVYDGMRAVRILPVGDGSVPKTGLYQDAPTRPGEYWTASVRAQSRPGDPVQGGNQAVLKLQFLDSAGASILQTNEIVVVDQSTPAGYTNAVLKQFAPVGAAFARITLEYRQVAGGSGSVDFDAASLGTSTDTTKLINAGLELYDGSTFPGWTEYGAGWNVIAETNALNARTGTNSAWMFGQFPTNGAANESGLHQDMTASRGQIWQASAWAQNRPGDGLQGSNHAGLKIEFLDANNSVLDRDEITVVSSNSPAGYQQFVLRRVAPQWTAKARIVLAFFQQNNANGSADFDDAELRQVNAHDSRPTFNSGFEDGSAAAFPNWTTWNNPIPNVLHESNTNFARTGAQCVKLFGPFNSLNGNCGLFQDFPAGPGEMWQASLWGRNRPGDALQADNSVRLKLEFYDTNSVQLVTNALTILNAASSTNYQQFTIRRVAPVGTSRARMVAEMLQPNYGGGAVNLDDAQAGVLTASDTNRVLLNGGFEVGQGAEFGEWIVYGPGNGQNVARDSVTSNARTGTQCLKLYGAFNGPDNTSGLYQDIPVAAGETWQASIWARNRPGDLLQGANTVLLKLEFVDAAGNSLQRDQVTVLTAGSSTNYRYYALRNIAPVGAAFARIVVEFDQYASAAGAADIDDTDLQLMTAQSGAPVLNAGFEYQGASSKFANWSQYLSAPAGSGANVRLDPSTNNARSGLAALQISGQATSAANFSGVYQDVPATEGQLLRASVWARNVPGAPLTGGNVALLKLEYHAGNGQLLTTSQQTTINAASSTNYQWFAILRPAPSGSARARIVLEMDQVSYASGSVDFDDAAIDPVAKLTGAQGAGQFLWDGALPPSGIVSLTGKLLLSSGASLQAVLAGPVAGAVGGYPQIQVAGSAQIGGSLQITVPRSFTSQNFIPRQNQALTLLTATNCTGTFASVSSPTGLGGGNAFAPAYSSTGVVLQVVKELDADANGLPDFWEQLYFGTAMGVRPDQDADGDGASNLAEFIAGTVPTNAASYFHITTVSNSASGLSVAFPSVTNLLYTLWFSSNLSAGSWTNVPAATDIPGAGGSQTLFDALATGAQRYYRLSVRMP